MEKGRHDSIVKKGVRRKANQSAKKRLVGNARENNTKPGPRKKKHHCQNEREASTKKKASSLKRDAGWEKKLPFPCNERQDVCPLGQKKKKRLHLLRKGGHCRGYKKTRFYAGGVESKRRALAGGGKKSPEEVLGGSSRGKKNKTTPVAFGGEETETRKRKKARCRKVQTIP